MIIAVRVLLCVLPSFPFVCISAAATKRFMKFYIPNSLQIEQKYRSFCMKTEVRFIVAGLFKYP